MTFLTVMMSSLLAWPQTTPETWQLQQLIVKSEQQIELLKQLLRDSNRDSAAIANASKILGELANGIDTSIKKYQGTPEYAEALQRLQSKDETYSDFQRLKKRNSIESGREIEYQKRTVDANRADMMRQEELSKLLSTAPPGLVPKIQAEAQISQWQTATRISSQLTELLASTRAIREELRSGQPRHGSQNIFNQLVRGAEMQNETLRAGAPP